ncbi:hypothetical protein [Bacillus marasmi]|uniref:hypothetical protein n=1 Tax=Bacillus marasmi TaxID=1926279 RepID=UPI0011C79D6B|nr:hypothetical protein [Bacillus marasmi]
MEFFFDNPFILVILIGIISSLFKKNKEAQQEKQKGNKPKPVRTEEAPAPVRKNRPSRAQQQNPSKSPRSKQPRQTSRERDLARENQTDVMDQRYAALKIHQEEPYHTNSAMESAPTQERNLIYRDDEQNKQRTLNVDSNALVDGLIWSEVLGPPRAKKAHRAVK